MPATASFITEHPLRPDELLSMVSRSSHGAQTLFLGVVRDHHEGRAVRAVTYDCFRPLAEKTLAAIASEAAARWKAAVACAHRVGTLELGEASVAIAVGCEHRAEAYEASRFVIEEIKRRLPVWKKEHYEGGDSAWLPGCGLHPDLTEAKHRGPLP